ncbi:MAG TPA: TrkA C-terminal domain-containing protein, partial [Candidatus Aminicenantes bacterium]|nr:TrkA C-terminal domain-containing protein [Candidatus Aminicenantes bacterium]
IVAKGIDVKSHGKMKRAGADYVVSPTFIGGMRMVSQMIRPAVVTFLDTMLREREEVLRFDEVHVGRGSPLVGKTLSHCGLREKSNALLVAIQRGGEKDYIFNPAQATAIREGDILIFIATPDSIREIEKA